MELRCITQSSHRSITVRKVTFVGLQCSNFLVISWLIAMFDSVEGGCLRCVSLHQKHPNVLQYKESRCVMPPGCSCRTGLNRCVMESSRLARSYREICRTISVDEPLKSLFRVGGATVHCPLTGTFSLSYRRGGGLCSYPLSSLHQCQVLSLFNGC